MLARSADKKLATAPIRAKERSVGRGPVRGPGRRHATTKRRKTPQKAGQLGQWRLREKDAAEERERYAAQCEPTDHARVDLSSVEPDAAAVADQLRNREDRDRVADAEGEDEHRQEHRCATEARDGRQRRGGERHGEDR